MNYRALIYYSQTALILCCRLHHIGAGTVLIITYLKKEIVAFLERELKLN